MELKSKFLGFSYDYSLKKWVVSLSVESTGEILQNMFDELKDKIVDLKLKVHSKKRSLDANAYYWKMLSLLAGKLGESNNAIHNDLLAEFSEVDTLDGQVITVELIESESTFKRVREESKYHLRATDEYKFKDGQMYRVFQMMVGSSQMDTRQMSRLINGLLDKCREQGIPTITDEECERMIAAYGHSIR